MSVADYEKQKRRVRKYFKRWAYNLGLDRWDIDLMWGYNGSDFIPEARGYQSIAFVTAKWEYRAAALHFNMHMLDGQTDTELEKIVLHELTHIPLFELERKATKKDFLKHREHVTVSFTQAFQRVRQAGFKEGQQAMKREMRSDR